MVDGGLFDKLVRQVPSLTEVVSDRLEHTGVNGSTTEA